MGYQGLLDDLSVDYSLIVRTQHHVQIKTTHGMHNIWFGKRGITFQPCGRQDARAVSPSELKSELANYEYSDTDLALMQRLHLIVRKVEGKTVIFCDAGFSGGRARVAIVRASEGDYDITVRLIETQNSEQAEDWAIKKALEMYPGNEPVFSDCQAAVNANQPRARWVSRRDNKEADSFGNVRRQG
jgi:fatty acid-binding protein DegV